MLKQLTFENFKSWRRFDAPIAPLTAFYGANSSGKSSILQFLLLLKQTKDSPDRSLPLDFGGVDTDADLGSFREAVHNHDEATCISWMLRWQMEHELHIVDPSEKRTETLFSSDELAIQSNVRMRNRVLANDFLEYDFAGAKFKLSRKENRPGFQLDDRPFKNFRFVRTPGRVWDLPGPTKSYAFPDQARTYFQNSQFLSEFEAAFVNQMDSILHLGPLRELPQRQYIWSGSSPIDVGFSGERTIEAILAATARNEKRNLKPKGRLKPFQEMIAWWLKEMGLIHSFEVSEIAKNAGLYRAAVKRDAHSPETMITDVGFGVSQVLPVLVLLYYAPEYSTVLLEQPEIHLHPAVQSSLADLIITVVKTRNIQVVVKSHSEHLLQRLLRRVAEGEASEYPVITPEDIKLYFCQSARGTSTAEELQIDMFGHIQNWPNDFFGDQFGEIAARDKAGLEKLKAQEK